MRRLLATVLLWLPGSALAVSFEPAKLPELTTPVSAPEIQTGLVLPGQAQVNPLGAVAEPDLGLPRPPALPESLLRQGILPAQIPLGAEIGPRSAPAVLSFGGRDTGRWTHTYHSLTEWAEEYRRAQESGLSDGSAVTDQLFDNAAQYAALLGINPGELPPAGVPKIPAGVRSVTVDAVNDARDIGRLIPSGINSDELIKQLVEHLGEMGQYRIYTYHARGDFVGIDLSARPDLVELLPEQQSHEVRLIKKIQAYNQDLRVLVREDGKTPDLIIGGVVTELKSLIGNKVDLTYLVDKANAQVLEHAERHDLGNGAAVVDLTAKKKVPVAAVLTELNAWARMPLGTEIAGTYLGPRHRKREIALDRVTVFAGEDVKVFARGPDGAYRVLDERPFQDFAVSRPKRKPRGPVKIAAAPSTALADAFEKSRILADLRGFRERGRGPRAVKAWEKFQETHRADLVESVRPHAEAILEKIRRDRDKGRKYRNSGGRRRGRG